MYLYFYRYISLSLQNIATEERECITFFILSWHALQNLSTLYIAYHVDLPQPCILRTQNVQNLYSKTYIHILINEKSNREISEFAEISRDTSRPKI